MNYSDKIKFDHWIESCPIDDVQVQPTTSMVRNGDGKWSYLVKVFLTIDKEDWDNNTPEDKEDPVDEYFECVSSCDTDNKECHNECTEELKENDTGN